MPDSLKYLTIEMIDASSEIQSWLEGFPENKQAFAINMLLSLRFVSRDIYSEWLKSTLKGLDTQNIYALYAVRKFEDDSITCVWDEQGEVIERPASSMGSEDLVHSVISNLMKESSTHYLDHPSIHKIKETKKIDVVLIDDSIGSGDRINSFIEKMMSNATFLSRWSLGCIRIHIIAYSRSIEASKKITTSIAGSDHGLRKYPKSSKISFHGCISFQASDISSRWGSNADNILDLCDSTTNIPKWCRRGYGRTMANIVFYHSIPNNLPGVLWFINDKYNGLFPKRSVPEWLPTLLDRKGRGYTYGDSEKLPKTLLIILQLIGRGIRNVQSLSRASCFDSKLVTSILKQACESGFVTSGNRLTEAGKHAVKSADKPSNTMQFDRSLYIPSQWCTGRESTQPSGPNEINLVQTESTSGSLQVDGGPGQGLLERTDAKTAAPSFTVTTQCPSIAREGGDVQGPSGPKEK
ncbi:MAG: hypothetical protein R8K50_08775 [Mariprofundus sp.]